MNAKFGLIGAVHRDRKDCGYEYFQVLRLISFVSASDLEVLFCNRSLYECT